MIGRHLTRTHITTTEVVNHHHTTIEDTRLKTHTIEETGLLKAAAHPAIISNPTVATSIIKVVEATIIIIKCREVTADHHPHSSIIINRLLTSSSMVEVNHRVTEGIGDTTTRPILIKTTAWREEEATLQMKGTRKYLSVDSPEIWT